MQLVSVRYSEYVGQNQEWTLNELTLGPKNLIVGRNSAGKTRTLHVIASLARTLSTPQNNIPPSGNYHCEWRSGKGEKYIYEYVVNNSEVVSEKLEIDGVVYLERKEGGYGSIYFKDVGDGAFMRFQTPVNEFAVIKRRDELQHPFIEPLYQWAAAVRHYFFGSPFGKELLAVFQPNGIEVNERDGNQVVGVFREGKKEFNGDFTSSIIRDMKRIGYDIEDVDNGFPASIPLGNVPSELNSVFVRERGVRGVVDQLVMSQGMYRVLALLIHVNYLQLKKTSTCVIIDDIGEGLDFDRSCKLISLLREKADQSNLQIIMSTNDKFVMNEVPLKEWTVLHRVGSDVKVSNYANSAEKFDEFRYTGLSNFSFFEMDYLESSGSGDD
ncbi:hypothetical protein ABVN23_21790 [Pseudomonas fluorescens]|uniref:hypothetical protein n=1 Tax=Pseudomonas fluorescens TaxID=294 RepID=UPI003F9B144F